jgi:orotate phosphoribosyltransferase
MKHESFELKRSASTFLPGVIKHIKDKKLHEGDSLTIKISPSTDNLWDLYTLGRILSLLNAVKRDLSIEVILDFRSISDSRIERLHSLGFFSCCKEMEIPYTPQVAVQGYLIPFKEVLSKKSYMYCLVPLTKLPISIDNSNNYYDSDGLNELSSETEENMAHKICHSMLAEISVTIHDSLESIGIKYEDVALEMSHILFVVLNELLLNAIMHSGEKELIVAVSLNRQVSSIIRPHRAGFHNTDASDQFEILVMDFGRGVLKSLLTELVENKHININRYCNILEDIDDYGVLLKENEESVLTSIFHGNLVIRKGRKSEGLYNLASRVAWFGGILNYRSLRTEVQYFGDRYKSKGARIRRHPRKYFLPGVIACSVLPSHQVRVLANRIKSCSNNTYNDEICIKPFEKPLEDLFKVQTESDLRRKVELYAKYIIEEYLEVSRNNQGKNIFIEINLGLSKSVNTEFLDNLIQELCKVTGGFSLGDKGIFSRIFFSNVRRRVIRSLENQNCEAFLKVIHNFCLFLDEVDQPYFIGIPRTTDKIFDLKDALTGLFFKNESSADYLQSKDGWFLSDAQIEYLTQILSSSSKSLFYYLRKDDVLHFYAHDIVGNLQKSRYQHLEYLENYIIPSHNKSAVRLSNGNYVSGIIDFVEFWDNRKRLLDCTKLLLKKASIPPVNTLVGFVHNGDKLAGAIQYLTGAVSLVMVDMVHSKSRKHIELGDRYALVIDVLYPGDEDGYIYEFVTSENRRPPEYILVFCDLHSRNDTLIEKKLFLDIPVISLLDHTTSSLPIQVEPNKEDVIYSLEDGTIYPELSSLLTTTNNTQQKYRGEHIEEHFPYDPIELSAEFWHNVSTLGIISPIQTGRESRQLLFYENNERIVQHQRTRDFLEEFVADFVKAKLHLKVDVIMHPTHPVGAFLASQAERNLSTNPKILSLRQREYGGCIEISKRDFSRFRNIISQFNSGSRKNVLILDDSVITGRSIFTMLGLAERLGLRVVGVLVLLNRMSPEISASLTSLPFIFTYLYRLHMEALSENSNPDIKVLQWSRELKKTVNSRFIFRWSEYIQSSPLDSYFLRDRADIEKNFKAFSIVQNFQFSEIDVIFKKHELRQIINGLLLHPNPHILSMYTRIAIAYNFFGRLVHEEVFWSLLRAFVDKGLFDPKGKDEIYFVRKILYLLAFSKYIYSEKAFSDFVGVCQTCIDKCFYELSWQQTSDFAADILMILGSVGSETLFTEGNRIIDALWSQALQYNGSYTNEARNILGAYAWSIAVLDIERKVSLNTVYREQIASNFDVSIGDGDRQILLLDIFASYIMKDTPLRERINILTLKSQDKFLNALKVNNNEQNDLFTYLSDAPGYTFTMLTALSICIADTVLLFAKCDTDDHYFLRSSEVASGITYDSKNPVPQFSSDIFSSRIQNRMNDNLFFFSNDSRELDALSHFSGNANHLWAFGVPVRQSTNLIGEQYYMIFAYNVKRFDDAYLRTAYYYWLQLEILLRDILPSIHEKHILSSTSTNALLNTLRSFHAPKLNDEKKLILAISMTLSNIGKLLQRAVSTSREKAMKPDQLLDDLRKTISQLKECVEQAQKNILKKEISLIPTGDGEWPIKFITSRNDMQNDIGYISFHNSILYFVSYECLNNALVHYKDEITVKLTVARSETSEDKDIIIKLFIYNDCLTSDRKEGTGLSACEAAIKAVGGRFDSKYDQNTKLWKTEIHMNAYSIPENFTKDFLYEYCK